MHTIGPGGKPEAGEERVGVGSVLGSPFVARGDRADDATVCYWELLKGEKSAHEIGKGSRVPVREAQGRVTHARRAGVLRALVARVLAGEVVYLRCPRPSDVPVGDLVRAWVERTVRRSTDATA